MRTFTQQDICDIAAAQGVALEPNWTGPGPIWSLIDRMRSEGAVVIIKLDGDRTSPVDNGQFTVIASGGRLGDAQVRGDFDTLESALCYLVGNYSQIAWS